MGPHMCHHYLLPYPACYRLLLRHFHFHCHYHYHYHCCACRLKQLSETGSAVLTASQTVGACLSAVALW